MATPPSQNHEDKIVPPDVRAERAQSIRDKLLGKDDDDDDNNKKKKKNKGKPFPDKEFEKEHDAHPHLTQMTKVMEQHIVHEELVDPNC